VGGRGVGHVVFGVVERADGGAEARQESVGKPVLGEATLADRLGGVLEVGLCGVATGSRLLPLGLELAQAFVLGALHVVQRIGKGVGAGLGLAVGLAGVGDGHGLPQGLGARLGGAGVGQFVAQPIEPPVILPQVLLRAPHVVERVPRLLHTFFALSAAATHDLEPERVGGRLDVVSAHGLLHDALGEGVGPLGGGEQVVQVEVVAGVMLGGR
jgi:hypothetical protein